MSFVGTYSPPLITGTLSGSLRRVEASFAGTYDGPIRGAFEAVLPGVTAAFEGTHSAGLLGGSFDVTLPQVASDLFGLYFPPVAEPPADQVRPIPDVQAIALPDPMIDDATGLAMNEAYKRTRTIRTAGARDRIVIDGVDITYYRGKTVQRPGYTLSEPFAYAEGGTLSIPQVWAGRERPSWARKGAIVFYQRVLPDDSVVTDFRGQVLAVNVSGGALRLRISGDPVGRANLNYRPKPLFRGKSDVGSWVYQAAGQIGIHMSPVGGPVVGREVANRGAMSQLAFLELMGQLSQDTDGHQRALMPAKWGKDDWRFEPKDYTTRHFTLYCDDARIAADLTDDAAEQPNQWFGEGVTPDGLRVRNGRYPGLQQGDPAPYPMADDSAFGVGTTDTDTDTGDGVSVMVSKLTFTGYVPFGRPLEYDSVVARGIRELQNKAGLAVTGTMTKATWNAMFDLDATGYDVAGAHIPPMVYDPRTMKWNYTNNGSYAGLNDRHDPSVFPVGRMTDFGSGLEKAEMIAYLRGEYARTQGPNWVGTISLAPGMGAITGEHNPGDPAITAADILPARDIRPGMNAWLPDFEGGILVHVSGVSVSEDGGVQLTVDTQARDMLEVTAIMERDAESRLDIRREWNAQNRSDKSSDNLITFDEFGGMLTEAKRCQGGKWNLVPVVMGQTGTVDTTILHTVNDAAKFGFAVLSREITPERLQNVIGNPLRKNANGESPWEEGGGTLEDWFDNNVILVAEGTVDEPCGYYPRRHKSDEGKITGAPITGKHLSRGSWGYKTQSDAFAVVWLAIYPDRDCTLKAGRVFYKREDDAV